MSRILAYTSPARGHLYPLTAVLLELRDRGHDVTVHTLGCEVAMLEGLGLRALPIDPAIEAIEIGDWRGRHAQQRLALSASAFATRAPLDAADLTAAIERADPELVIVDVNTWGAQAVAERWGGAWAAFQPYPTTLSAPDVPPFGPGLPPARGLPGRLRDRALRPVLRSALERAFLPSVNAVRAEVGVGPLGSTDDMTLTIPTLLYCTAEPFEYPRAAWPESVVMVGPCAWEPPVEPPGWVAELEGPITLVTTSSEFQDDGRLALAALDGLADAAGSVIVTMPSAQLPDPARIPPNARVVEFLPHAAVLARASVVVTHGGMGATQKALTHGVPVVVVPFGRDQLEVARRVEVAGAGVRLPLRRLSPERLREAVARAERERPGAERIARAFAAAGGPVAAADTLEGRLAAGGEPRPRPTLAG
jgi:MGT family glycosyltransferase